MTGSNTDQQNKIELLIDGMSCASCVGRVERCLKKISTVADAQVNLATEKATVFSTQRLDPDILIQAVEKAGYAASLVETEQLRPIQLQVDGMSCASCVGRVQRALVKIEQVADAQVNLATEQADVYLNAALDPAVLIQALDKAGYPAQLIATHQHQHSQELVDKRQLEAQQLYRQLLIAVVLALPVVVLEMGGHLFPAFHHFIQHRIGIENSWLIQWFFASLVLIFPGQRFYLQGIPALLRAAPDMNSLVALGTIAAYGYSLVATFSPQVLPLAEIAVYYESAVVIICLILFGRYLEAKAKGRTSQAIAHLLGLQPQTAHLIRGQQIIDIAVQDLQLNDVVLVKAGEKIPTDAKVIDGSSYVDESMMTGEPMAVRKQANDLVIGGSVNQQGALQIKCSAIGQDTVLAQIVRMVESAQGAKLPIQTLVDKITLWFVPAVMLIAGLTFVLWMIFYPAPALSMALINAVAVLIIACPCAMGLATPTSIMVGTGRAAELGVLFRNGEALQQLKDAAVVAFDKTGTLTQGKAKLTDFQVDATQDADLLLSYAASLEQYSEHPIAKAVVDAAAEKNLSLQAVSDFKTLVGYGIQAEIAQQQLYLGAARWMQQLNLDLGPFSQLAEQLAAQGKTPFYLANAQQLLAIFAVSDPLKAHSQAAIQRLHQLGLKVAMISGDQSQTAHAIANQLGIDTVVAEVLPDQKVTAVLQLKAQYGRIAYVGDGINDAPALAAADIGIAIGTGTDIAIESADVVLMSGNIQGVVNAIALSKACLNNIKQNLFWAFAYNVALIPIAAGILYPQFAILLSPMFAAAAMALSSVFVLSNALRLKAFQAPC